MLTLVCYTFVLKNFQNLVLHYILFTLVCLTCIPCFVIAYMRRYPIILRCFLLNNGTGGNGQYRGGDGVKRELMFRRQLKLSVLTERRIYHPYGLEGIVITLSVSLLIALVCDAGGSDGSKGKNTLVRTNGSEIDLGSKASADVKAGVRLNNVVSW